MFECPEKYRYHYPPSYGNNGLFMIPLAKKGKKKLIAKVIASDGAGWEHVSVSLNRDRCPLWEEMCKIKALFWGPEDVVVQYHPAESNYVNLHPYCLHLWRPNDGNELRTPEAWMVGPK